MCHGPGLAGAPRYGSKGVWAPRLKAGTAKLYSSALKGTPNGMPGKGGNLSLSDAEVKAAVDYLLASVVDTRAAAAPAKPAAAPAKAAAVPPDAAPAKVASAAPVAVVPAPVAPPAPRVAAAAPAPAGSPDPNAFNRLLAAPGKRNAPPAEDGIHDASNASTHALQPPLAALAGMPALGAGNRVNWVASLEPGKIRPRWDRDDPAANALVMDLNIVREVKGSMPDVVYPHKQHTEWLDCSYCHPADLHSPEGVDGVPIG